MPRPAVQWANIFPKTKMSRLKRAIHGVASSYVALVATALYSLASIPVALHYLDKERFGLWALMTTLVGYLSLVDASMSGSAGRLLIDHKDHRDSGRYGSFVQTVSLVTVVQGLIVLVVGLVLAGLFAQLLAIPAGLHAEFIRLVHLQCAAVALGFATRIFYLILTAHQRMDMVNYIATLGLAVNFATQWLFFHFGFGVLSLAWGALAAALTLVICQWLACEVQGLLPERGTWGKASWAHFKEIFDFGKDLFLVAVGTQLIMASQTIVITRVLGLPVAAVWSVGLRVFTMVTQVIGRISDMSMSAFAEMMVRGELARLRERYQTMVTLTASLGGFAAVSFALCNSLFIPLWTHGKISWPAANDVLLGAWLMVLAISRCHISLVLLTKQIRFMRYVYFMEGLVFVTLSLLLARLGGLPAIIGCSVVCGTVFSGAYCTWRVSRYFNLPLREVAWGWLQPMPKMLALYLPVAILLWWTLTPLPGMVRLATHIVLAGSIGLGLFLRYGVPPALQKEILRRIPQRVYPVLRHVFAEPAS